MNAIGDSQTWVDADLYLYGELTESGGDSASSIHLVTEEFGLLHIAIGKEDAPAVGKKPLHAKCGVRVAARQNLRTFEIDRTSLRFLELLDYGTVYSEPYLNTLVEKAARGWAGTDASTWLAELRGYAPIEQARQEPAGGGQAVSGNTAS